MNGIFSTSLYSEHLRRLRILYSVSTECTQGALNVK